MAMASRPHSTSQRTQPSTNILGNDLLDTQRPTVHAKMLHMYLFDCGFRSAIANEVTKDTLHTGTSKNTEARTKRLQYYRQLGVGAAAPASLDRTRGVRLRRAGRALDLVPEVDVDGLDGGVAAQTECEHRRAGREESGKDVLLEGVLAELAADTRLLVATEGDLWVQLVRTVDLHIARPSVPPSRSAHKDEYAPKSCPRGASATCGARGRCSS